jgi:hypothetical protein
MSEIEPIPPEEEAPEVAGVADAEVVPEVETPEIPEIAKENEAMIDIHVPHQTHTWKDFWIHLGTITAGLLIAISLEQSVEKLHHLRQRHELETSLRAEGDVNKERAEVDLARYDDEMTWLLGLHEDIGKMLATGGNANLPYREIRLSPLVLQGNPYTGGPMALMTAVWDTANADSRLALLPDDEAHAYSLLYHIREERFDALRLLAEDAMDRQAAFEGQFADIGAPKTPVLARMSAADLKEYDALAMQSFTAMRVAKLQLRIVYASSEAVRQELYDMPSLYRVSHDVGTRFADDYGKMAREVEAEDAARDKVAAPPAEKGAR